jgi:hypothetical protein
MPAMKEVVEIKEAAAALLNPVGWRSNNYLRLISAGYDKQMAMMNTVLMKPVQVVKKR